jgi:hypothetical protein
MSVGFVTCRQLLRSRRVAPTRLYTEELAACPEIAGLLDGAELVRIVADQTRDVSAIRDWSYESRQLVGPGWAMVGDSAGFVDPILSSGVMLAQELGQKAAYAINSMFRSQDDGQAQAVWAFYQETYRTYLRAYREMAAFWYANNFSMDSWWWQARRALDSAEELDRHASPEAFIRIASGYANRAESLSLFGSYPLNEAAALVDGLFGVPQHSPDVESRYRDIPVCLDPMAKVTDGLYFYRGLVRSTRRVLNGARTQQLDLHPGEEALIDLLDGRHTLDDLNRLVAEIRRLDNRVVVRSGTELVLQLEQIGALA